MEQDHFKRTVSRYKVSFITKTRSGSKIQKQHLTTKQNCVWAIISELFSLKENTYSKKKSNTTFYNHSEQCEWTIKFALEE